MEKPLKLISFRTCPYVQRSVILLLEKKIPFEIEYIDLRAKPDWFLKLSPLGKVPVLCVGKEVLFESAVIAEYLDEVNPPSLHPQDPLQKAKNRAWIEFGSGLFMAGYYMSTAPNWEQFEEHHEQLTKLLNRLEAQLGEGPFFNGSTLSLVDIAIAPIFMRVEILSELYGKPLIEGMPKVITWGAKLMELDSVKNSVVPEFKELYLEYLRTAKSPLIKG